LSRNRRRLRVARRELASLRSEKTIVLALLIQVFVAAFSSFLVVGLVSLYDPGATGGFDVEVAVAGDDVERLVAVVEDEPGVDARAYDTRAGAMADFESSTAQAYRVDAVLLTDRRADGTVEVTARVPDGSFETTLVVVQVRDVLQSYERTLREDRADRLETDLVELPDRAPSSPYFGFTYTVLVPLLLFLPTFIGGSVAVDSLSEEVERGTLELLRVTPTTLPEIIDGKLVAAAAPVPVQVAAWFLLLRFNGTVVRNLLPLVLFAGALAVAVSAVGLGVAAATRDRRQAQFLYSTGLLVLFAATLTLPQNPQNVVARLAIGSPGPGTWASLAGTVVLAAVTLVVVRAGVQRVDTDAL
jgi:ABC-2 type transport system permease protein